jgi:hypothetical protein
MREQVADRRARRPGRLVEVDRAVLDRSEDGEGGRELRDRRPTEDPLRIAVMADHAICVRQGHGSVGRSPSIDGNEGRLELGRHSVPMLSDCHEIDAERA